MCKAHSKMTHIKQQKYFHHLKGCGYNKDCIIVVGFLLTAGIGRPSTERDRPSTVSRYTQSWSSMGRLNVMPKTTKQNRIERTGKCDAEVTNN